ncbi:MAG: lytic transglycosylase domain-containing protein [Bryobacteraceae bacterium]
MLAASPIPAADATASAKPERKTIVVRADPRTGKLIRTAIAPPRPKHINKDLADLAAQTARANDVDPLLVHSIIEVESGFDPLAISPKGAEGLMQLTPPTARMMGVSNSFDPRQNIEAGVKYLKYLQSVYKDDRLALAAYNAGPGAVEKYKQVPPYKETRNYVSEVGRRYSEAQKAAAAKSEAVLAEAPPIVAETHPKLEEFIDADGRLHLTTIQ